MRTTRIKQASQKTVKASGIPIRVSPSVTAPIKTRTRVNKVRPKSRFRRATACSKTPVGAVEEGSSSPGCSGFSTRQSNHTPRELAILFFRHRGQTSQRGVRQPHKLLHRVRPKEPQILRRPHCRIIPRRSGGSSNASTLHMNPPPHTKKSASALFMNRISSYIQA